MNESQGNFETDQTEEQGVLNGFFYFFLEGMKRNSHLRRIWHDPRKAAGFEGLKQCTIVELCPKTLRAENEEIGPVCNRNAYTP